MKLVRKAHMKWLALCVFVASAFVAALPGAALATESETASKVKEVATKVGSEGIEILLIVLAALVSLIVAVIIIPKAIQFIRRFV